MPIRRLLENPGRPKQRPPPRTPAPAIAGRSAGRHFRQAARVGSGRGCRRGSSGIVNRCRRDTWPGGRRSFSPRGKAAVGVVGPRRMSTSLEGGVEVVADQAADLQGLGVILVGVAGGEGERAEHDPPLHLGAEALGAAGHHHPDQRGASRLLARDGVGEKSAWRGGRRSCRRSGRGCWSTRPGRRGSRPAGRTSRDGRETSVIVGRRRIHRRGRPRGRRSFDLGVEALRRRTRGRCRRGGRQGIGRAYPSTAR